MTDFTKPDRATIVQDLRPGDIVQHVITGMSYVVTDNYGEYAIAVRTAHITNPSEWKLVNRPATRRK